MSSVLLREDTNLKVSWFEKVKRKTERILTFCRNIVPNIVMIYQWIPILWNNWDWDYIYFFKVVEYKLKRMEDHILEHDLHSNSKKIAKEIKIARLLLERIQNKDYVEVEMKHHKEKYGKVVISTTPSSDKQGYLEVDMYRERARSAGLEKQEKEESLLISRLSEDRRNRDLDYFFSHVRKKILCWWC